MTDYGDGPERGNAQTWAFMAAECARLLRERDEARREVKRLRETIRRVEAAIAPMAGTMDLAINAFEEGMGAMADDVRAAINAEPTDA